MQLTSAEDFHEEAYVNPLYCQYCQKPLLVIQESEDEDEEDKFNLAKMR